MGLLKTTFLVLRWSVIVVAAWSLAPCIMAQSGERAQREAQRRNDAVVEAMVLLRKGDEAYLDTDYKAALEAFAGAREMIPNVPASAELHHAATERFVTASIEHARSLARQGDLAEAKKTVNRVLDPAIAPDHPAAIQVLGELNDPIRYNPALTKKHAADVDQVRRTLYLAEGAYHLGKFDEANRHYERVLQMDPANRAARRGMERVASRISTYQRTAYDQTRAEMLAQVDSQWELAIPADDDILNFETMTGDIQGGSSAGSIREKIQRIIIPTFRLEEATLQEAVDLLRVRSTEYDTGEPDALERGVNINLLGIEAGDSILNRRINIQLSNASIAGILKYLCDATGTQYSIEDFTIIIRPMASLRGELTTRTFRVPPDFISSLSTSIQNNQEAADPFAVTPQQGLLPQRVGIREALEANGIEFTEGTNASLNQGILRITHTPAALEIVEQLVESISETEPISVITRVTIMRVQESTLDELGFDWLLGNFKIGSGAGDYVGIGGGTQGNGGSFADLDPLNLDPSLGPITAGNRSGGQAITPGLFTTGVTSSNQVNFGAATRAPGILGVSGVINNTTAQMILRGLSQKNGTDMLNQPSIVTSNGQAASIRVIREFPFPTEYDPPQVPQQVAGGAAPVTPANPQNFEMREVGIMLDVLPLADATRNYVELSVAPNITQFDGFINYGSPIQTTTQNPLTGASTPVELTKNEILQPLFSVSKVNSSVTIADGATVVIGGLTQSRVEDVQDQTPILGDLPVVGRLFQSKARQPVRTAWLFFVNVELVDPTGRPLRDR